jgi:hypothetical protein
MRSLSLLLVLGVVFGFAFAIALPANAGLPTDIGMADFESDKNEGNVGDCDDKGRIRIRTGLDCGGLEPDAGCSTTSTPDNLVETSGQREWKTEGKGGNCSSFPDCCDESKQEDRTGFGVDLWLPIDLDDGSADITTANAATQCFEAEILDSGDATLAKCLLTFVAIEADVDHMVAVYDTGTRVRLESKDCGDEEKKDEDDAGGCTTSFIDADEDGRVIWRRKACP